MCKILCVTNRALCREDFLRRIERIAAAKPDGIILREKDLDAADYAALAQRVIPVCKQHHVPCILHSFAGAAASAGASAIHLPLPVLRVLSPEDRQTFAVIGASCHSTEEAQEAAALGAAYLTAGHVFATDCKRGLPGRGLGFLRDVCRSVDVPVYAIGGITPENVPDILQAGAAGVCIMSSLMTVEDPAALLKQLRGE